MVGTALYQGGAASSSQAKDLRALKPGGQESSPHAVSDDRTAPIRAWIWNSGMMLRQRSVAVSPNVSPMWRAEARMLRWESGTSFGREVVPEVCSSRATSSASAIPPAAGAAPV